MAPLTPAVFHILIALADGDKHGYAIMIEVSSVTHGNFLMGPGTLYGTLKRMLAAGFVTESGQRRDSGLDGERRRYYRITAKGRSAAREETERLDAVLRVAAAKSLLKRPRSA